MKPVFGTLRTAVGLFRRKEKDLPLRIVFCFSNSHRSFVEGKRRLFGRRPPLLLTSAAEEAPPNPDVHA